MIEITELYCHHCNITTLLNSHKAEHYYKMYGYTCINCKKSLRQNSIDPLKFYFLDINEFFYSKK